MWKRATVALSLLVFTLHAQEAKSRVPTATAGYGNILYPGTGAPPAAKPQFARPIFPQRTHTNYRNVQPATSVRSRVLILPMYFPLPFYGFAPGMNEQFAAPAEPAPVAIENQAFIPERPQAVVRDYPEGSLPAPFSPEEDKPTVYLIAMKDSTVHSAFAYWVEDGTLHYITKQLSPNRVSIDLIDPELSTQLNRERGVEFKLPTQ